MIKLISKLFIIVFLFALMAIPPVSALKLLAVNDDNNMFQTATLIPDPFNNSYFTLETFEREGQSHWYAFVGEKGMVIAIQTLVPDIDSSRDFVPSFDLIIGVDKRKIQRRQKRNDFRSWLLITNTLKKNFVELVEQT